MRVIDERLSLTSPSDRHSRADRRGRETTESRADGPTCPSSLIVVSNRQPYRHEYDDAASAAGDDQSAATATVETRTDGAAPEPTAESGDRSITVDEPTGGLTAGLDPVLKQSAGTWIAWGDGDADFDVADEQNCVAVPPDDPSYTLQRIDLSDEAVDSYYYGFSNRVLWPLCHGFTDLVEHRSNDLEWYRTVNERFAEAVCEHATADSVVWLQDYHFALASRMIRETVPRSTTVAQFWHIPWPTAATFQHCPAGRRLLEGLLGNDLLGFHVDRYVERFLDCVDRSLPAAAVDWGQRTVTYDGETTRVVATPMGVDTESYDRNARSSGSSQLSSLLERYDIERETVIGLGVDRLDYTKGIPERLAAIERFLEWNPSWHGEFTFVQTATPSRTEIQTYERHGELVRSEVKRINQRFGIQDWDPIVYTEDYLTATELCALYRRADLMVVSPLVDGMNLVAQEYVAASVDGDGTLVLSQETGAHETLGSQALTIDPTDIDGFAHQLERAVSLPAHERKRRMNTLRNRVFDGNLEWWMKTQFDWIRAVKTERHRSDSTRDTDSGADRDTDSDSDMEFGPHEPSSSV
ncbi:alpha,alpha-trehalose-phosphate synthase (UDP-forming) [Natronorubrum sulfidifaciens]|uniref:Alpha,alpha-trehalose-phosphate synthase (UDP-forming) n=1 Tax=Natronorubrum sulfidifaciens JCM 14089 TaxID=1230460 RepID=L9WK92_9EURY|nr:trehalose-6-phosphate synthase [Natronorubrum sulfidifaciens]ELY49611.1 Alpha,alpha-trehalose-phosphate synthase (UDP- forming) [Natronorubrum sulfidifaciens JCM 14089]